MTSIKDIARIAGVSPATVSRAINGKAYVRPDMRERILEVVRQTGYVPNRAARSMVLKRSFTVGLVVPEAFNMFQRQLFSTIEHCLEVLGYHTLFFFAGYDAASEERCLRRIKSENFDGLIMMHEPGIPDFYAYLGKAPVPVVLCTFAREGMNLPSVHVDEEEAARDATAYLTRLGHRRIALLSGSHFSFAEQRSSGYRRALAAAGLPFDESLSVKVLSYTTEDGHAGMRELLRRGADFSALFAVTDELAIGAMRALFEEGLEVPGDVSVVGFDDIDISAYLAPGLTTVRQPIGEMGRRTAELMFARISGGPAVSAVYVHGLVTRESARPFDGRDSRSRAR